MEGAIRSKIRIKLNILHQVILVSVKQWSAYRANILTVFVIAPIQMLAQYFIWKSVISVNGSIYGMNLSQILTYYAVTTILSIFLGDGMAVSLSQLIYNGELNTLLLKPVSYFYYSFSEKIGKKIISIFVEVLPLALIFIFIFKINLKPQDTLWSLVSIALGFIQVYLVNFCIGITAFWLVDNWGVSMSVRILAQLLSGQLVPLSFFPGSLQKLFFFLPFQYMYYVPTSVLQGNYQLAGLQASPQQIVAVQLVYVAAMWMMTGMLWKKGLKTYMGVGT